MRLNHFTNIQAAEGIIRSKKLWATRWGNSIDSKERVALDYFKKLIADHIEQNRAELNFEGLENEVIDDRQVSDAEAYLTHIMGRMEYDDESHHTYVICFTEVDDDEYMWRGYCQPNDQGVRLSFDGSELLGNVKSSLNIYNERFLEAELVNCIYIDKDIRKLEDICAFDGGREIWTGLNRRNFSRPHVRWPGSITSRNDHFLSLVHRIIRFSMRLKKWYWRHDREARMVLHTPHYVHGGPSERSEYKLHPGLNAPTRVEVPIYDISDRVNICMNSAVGYDESVRRVPIPLADVRISPYANREEIRDRLSRVLVSNSVECAILDSEAPVRPGS